MTHEEQLSLVHQHYALGLAGNQIAARELLTDDFQITIPYFMPFGGTYRSKDAFRELIPIVLKALAIRKIDHIATTVGEGYAMGLVEFTLEGHDGQPLAVAEVIKFRDNKICEIRPYYYDPFPMIKMAEQRSQKVTMKSD
ncbi:nuclear transport factor 2 family protein [Polaromonas glacialis]|uniref:nuclear transport factor 2 family protein n=1 Tax=Polaromonas glacialis TaxID=866564 RepID=UPI000497C4F5|nr:hypothetical protein [Polaromonas glacialis]